MKFDRQPKSNSVIHFYFPILILTFLFGCGKFIASDNTSYHDEYFDLANLSDPSVQNKIQILELHAKQFKNQDLEKLPPLPKLSILSLRGTQISSLSSLSFSKFPKLATILANETNLDDAGILNWSNPPIITKLNFSKTKIESVSWASQFPKLRHLNIEFTKVQSIEEITYCPDVINLWLADTSIKDIKPLYTLKNLVYVSIDSLDIPKEELLEFRKELPYTKLVRRGSIF